MVKRDQAKRQDAPSAEPAPMPAADRPQYRQYQPVKRTDGIQVWVEERFDMTKPFTEDDKRAWRRDVESPQARILEMRKRVAALAPDSSSAIWLHASAILSLYNCLSIQLKSGGNASQGDWYSLREADDLWLKIMVLRDVMPRAAKGARFSRGKPKGAAGDTTRYLRESRRPGETAPELWERIKNEDDARAPVYFDGDTMYERGVYEADGEEKTISFEAFEKRLNRRKSQ